MPPLVESSNAAGKQMDDLETRLLRIKIENLEKDMRMMRENYEGRIAALVEEEVNKRLEEEVNKRLEEVNKRLQSLAEKCQKLEEENQILREQNRILIGQLRCYQNHFLVQMFSFLFPRRIEN